MTQGLPYRPPASANDAKEWNAVNRFMRCGNHFKFADYGVPFYTNTTQVTHDTTNAHDHLGAVGAPFTRGVGSGADKGAWNLPSNVCYTPDVITANGVGGSQLSTSDYPNSYNFYHASNTKLNFADCRDRGWKAIRAERFWHGVFGFKDKCSSSPPSTRYLKAHVRVRRKRGSYDPRPLNCSDFADFSPVIVWDLEREFEIQVDPESGVLTMNSATTTEHVGTWSISFDELYLETAFDISNSKTCGDDYDLDCGEHVAEYGYPGTDVFQSTNTYLRYQKTTSSEEATDYHFTDCEITLSNPHTLADVQADVKTLVDVWNLSSRRQYKFRTDGYCGFHPFIVRDEVNAPSSPLIWILETQYNQTPLGGGETEADHQSPWKMNGYCWNGSASVVSPLPTGNIIGRPLPNGYDRVFNFSMLKFDNTYHASGCDGDIIGYGMTSPGILPITSTNWMQNFENWEHNQASCSFAPYAKAQAWTRTTIDGIQMQVYAEVKEWWASQNFFRPAGEDRAKTAADGSYLWPKAWGILGREKVTVEDIGSGKIQFTLPAIGASDNSLWPSRDLRVGDSVRIFPTAMTLQTASPYNQTPLGDVVIIADPAPTATTFCVTATFATHSTAFWAMGGIPAGTRNLNDLPAYSLNDTSPKGDFVFIYQTSSNAGASAVTKAQHSIEYTPCCPSVLSIGYANQSVEGKSFPNGFNFSIPAVTVPATVSDVQIWRGAVVQRMQDRLYIDKVACTSPGCNQAGCNAIFCDKDIDAVRPANYPYQFSGEHSRNWNKIPWVEAMNELPTWTVGAATVTAPAFPSGDQLGAGNTLTPSFPSFALPPTCTESDAMKIYTSTLTYVDKPWTYTDKNYMNWNA